MDLKQYCIDIFKYKRYKSTEVQVGNIKIGGDNPIVVQSMTTTNTNDIDATIEQIRTISQAGGQLVRMTTQGQREARCLEAIKKGLVDQGYTIPLVADIHFNPNAANLAAQYIEKVRINPGNFADGSKRFENIEHTETSYQQELEQIKDKLIPLINICKENHTALRIGTNHGSLSDRIMSKYGDTPIGMVESCMEFLRICREQDFNQIVLSIKSSNARVMVHTVRLLIQHMYNEGMNYPLHLGVTEAGEGEDGRIRSAVGIGTLLADGIGDTIRVSLTENPENEIPIANQIIQHINKVETHPTIQAISTANYSPFSYTKRESSQTGMIGGKQDPVIIGETFPNDKKPDIVYTTDIKNISHSGAYILPYKIWSKETKQANVFPLTDLEDFLHDEILTEIIFVKVLYSQMNDAFAKKLALSDNIVLILQSENINSVAEQRAAFLWLTNHDLKTPVVMHKCYDNNFNAETQIKASCDFGPLLMDGFGDGVWIEHKGKISTPINATLFSILQAARVRFSKPDYISCPGCGRTLYNLQETTKKVKEKTSHLKGLKIAVMGCIVNGPGEMADADYGYVGSGPGKITLYYRRQIIKKNIPEKDAVNELIQLIKEKGDWIEAI